MIKTLEYDYSRHEASCTLQLDTEKFMKEDAQVLLDFFSWDYPYDTDANPVDEYMKKVAMECIKVATFNNYNEKGVISEFEEMEGWPRIDGTNGITLLDVSTYEFYEGDLDLIEK